MENAMSATPGRGVLPIIDRGPTANKWLSLYWIATVYLIVTSFWGGSAAMVHARPLFDEVLRLGYPPHSARSSACGRCSPRRHWRSLDVRC